MTRPHFETPTRDSHLRPPFANTTTRSTPPPKLAVNTHDTGPHPDHTPTDNPTGDPTPPDSPANPDLDNTEPCEALTF